MADRKENDFLPGEDAQQEAIFKAALADVPVPAGLNERIKSALRSTYAPASDASSVVYLRLDPVRNPAAIREPAVLNEPAVANTTALEQVLPAETDNDAGSEVASGSSGWLARSLVILALAAGVCGFAFLANRWTRPAEPTWLASQCDVILEMLENDSPANWQPLAESPPAIPARVQSQLARLAFVGQRPLSAFTRKFEGTIYRLDAGDGRGIVLIRLHGLPAIRGLTSRFEILPTPSGGWSLAAVVTGKETFVLAAACTEQQIFHYIRRLDLT